MTQIPLAIVEGLVGVLLMNALRSWAGPELAGLGFGRDRGFDAGVAVSADVEAKEASRA